MLAFSNITVCDCYLATTARKRRLDKFKKVVSKFSFFEEDFQTLTLKRKGLFHILEV
jgi:hypothetical protein